MVPPCCTLWNSAIVRVIQIIVDIFGWKLKVTAGKGQSLIMAQILQRDLFVRRLSIYQVRISRLISRWISRWIWSSNFRVTPCKGRSLILDSTLWISRFLYWIPYFSKKLELGFRIPIVGGIPDSKDQDSVFHKRICSGFRILQTKLSILTFE